MKLILVCILFCLGNGILFAQAVTPAKSTKPMTLKERYQDLKANTETFNEYKVIKEYQLDREWKIFNDSIQSARDALRSSRADVTRLEGELKHTQDFLRQKEESIAPLELAGTHINFVGIDFAKGLFITIVLLIIGGLAFLVGVVALRMKNIQSSLNDRVSVINDLNHEFEEYRHKALEKQTKLSRELQNERNKLEATRRPEGSGTRHP